MSLCPSITQVFQWNLTIKFSQCIHVVSNVLSRLVTYSQFFIEWLFWNCKIPEFWTLKLYLKWWVIYNVYIIHAIWKDSLRIGIDGELHQTSHRTADYKKKEMQWRKAARHNEWSEGGGIRNNWTQAFNSLSKGLIC